MTDRQLAALRDGDEADAERRRLSPFDQAALEQALQLRDRQPGTQISVVVFAATAQQALLQSVAAFRPDRLQRLTLSSTILWNLAGATEIFRRLLADEAPDLVLIGQEFGDTDTSVLPPYVAQACAWRFVGHAQTVQVEDNAIRVIRSHGGGVETLRVVPPALVAMVNDRATRLRHPLLKNVMAARRETAPALTMAAGDPDRLRLVSAEPMPTAPRSARCHFLAGSVAEQAATLADWFAARPQP